MTVNERTCSRPDCDEKHKAKGLCNTHYERRRTGKSLDPPIRQYETGERLCKAEGCDKPRACSGTYCAAHYYQPRKKLYRYGLDEVDYQQMLDSQGHRCAVCRTEVPRGAKGLGWCVDHDHVTGQVRGVLCGTCNSGIGMLKDDPDLIVAAARYVQKHRQMVLFGPAVQP